MYCYIFSRFFHSNLFSFCLDNRMHSPDKEIIFSIQTIDCVFSERKDFAMAARKRILGMRKRTMNEEKINFENWEWGRELLNEYIRKAEWEKQGVFPSDEKFQMEHDTKCEKDIELLKELLKMWTTRKPD